MIKIGVYGISAETIALTAHLRREKKGSLTGFSFPPSSFSATPVKEAAGLLSTDPEEVLLRSDLMILSDPGPDDLLFIRAAIRMARPLFFVSTARLPLAALQEINALAQEGEVPVHCYNALRDHPRFRQALQETGKPLFSEIIRRWRPEEGNAQKIMSPLLHSVEATLHMNNTHPRRPAAGAFFRPEIPAGMVHIQLTFDDGMTALIRHELSGGDSLHLCRIMGEQRIVTVDLEPRHHPAPPPRSRTKNRKGEKAGLLYRSLLAFMQPAAPCHFSSLEERIHATRLTQYIRDKINRKTLKKLPAENDG